MGYFATRSAALGVVPAEVVTACFYNFKHTMVARALPDAWSYASPQQVYQARLQVVDEALRRLARGLVADPTIAEAARIAVHAASSTDLSARPLAAAHRALPLPDAPHQRLFWACSVLREYRGDAHNLALATAGIDGCQAHVIMQAYGLVPAGQREYRGWTSEDWQTAVASLQQRGWLNDAGGLTSQGRSVRGAVEQRTDDLSRRPWEVLAPNDCERLATVLAPLAARITTQGGLPYPNAIGSPPVPELAVRA